MNPIKIDPEIMGGEPCFTGTRVPVKSLFDWLKGGYTVEYYLEQFPTVQRQHLEAVLDFASSDVLIHADRSMVSV
jgi:uncharacterized protein (DUF433 family)